MLLLLIACNSGPMTVVTYNAGLAEGFVPGTLDRAQKTADAVAAVEADVICLQEVWQPEHAALFTAGWEHSLVPDPQQDLGEGAACTEDDLSSLKACLDEDCADACNDELVDCVFDNCLFPFLGLDTTCQSCVMANVGGDVDAVTSTCLQESTAYAYDGSFGTALVSAHPILSSEEHVFSSTTNRRSVLHAVVDGPLGDTDVYCTHLTAIFDLIPYTGVGESWEAEQAQQIGDLSAFVDGTASGPVVLLGDFNNGPDQHAAHYADLSQGFVSPYVRDSGVCTYCADNPLNSEDSEDRVIDHVLLRDVDLDSASERVLDEPVEIEVCGEAQDGAYSDHYGVRVTIGG